MRGAEFLSFIDWIKVHLSQDTEPRPGPGGAADVSPIVGALGLSGMSDAA